jgi:hypothetical protein
MWCWALTTLHWSSKSELDRTAVIMTVLPKCPTISTVQLSVLIVTQLTGWFIRSAFWIWAEDCSFYFYPLYVGVSSRASLQYLSSNGTTADKATANKNWGQRPSVIIRGNTPGHFGINTVYLLHFGRIVTSGGSFQYQQVREVSTSCGITATECCQLSISACGWRPVAGLLCVTPRTPVAIV